MKIVPSPITAALAGAFAGAVMPVLWSRFAGDGLIHVAAFLLVVALPAHAFVVGFGRHQEPNARSIDVALLKRVASWLLAAVLVAAAAQVIRS